MKHLLIGITAAITVAAIGQARAQAPLPGPQQAQLAPNAAPYPFNAPTPEDAYRQGLINRWELEQLTGPLPQALKGPPVNGDRGNGDGGGRN
jgi:hypothetical protein